MYLIKFIEFPLMPFERWTLQYYGSFTIIDIDTDILLVVYLV